MTCILTVDAVLFTLVNEKLNVALVKREAEPFKGAWALPGGYVHEQEDGDAKAAANRVLLDKAGATSPYLEELGTRSGVARDPRGWSLTVIYYALVPHSCLPESTKIFSVDELPHLAFDHAEIVASALERVRSKATYSSLPVFLLEEFFTITQLQKVYEAVLDEKLDKSNFRRKLDEMNLIEELPGRTKTLGASRPAKLYTLTKPFKSRLSVRVKGI